MPLNMPAGFNLAGQKACLARYTDDGKDEAKNLLMLLFPFSKKFLKVKPGVLWVCDHCGVNLVRNAERRRKGRRWEPPTI